MAMVLIADERRQNLELMGKKLAQMGHKVVESRTGNDAISRALACTPDLVVSDIEMGDVDGLEVVNTLRKQVGWDMPIVLVTRAHDHTSLARRIREKGLDPEGTTLIMSKPINNEMLMAIITGLLENAKKHRLLAQV